MKLLHASVLALLLFLPAYSGWSEGVEAPAPVPASPPPKAAEVSPSQEQVSRDEVIQKAGKNFVGAFNGSVDGARYFVEGIWNHGALVYRISPESPYNVFLGKVESDTKIVATGIGGATDTLTFEFKEGSVRIETTAAKGAGPRYDKLTREAAIPDLKSFLARYFGKPAKPPVAVPRATEAQ